MLAELTLLTGIPEVELREHSTTWIEDLARKAGQHRARDRADLLELIAIGAAAPHADENVQNVTETIEKLRAAAEGDVPEDYLLNPDAQPDVDALNRVLRTGMAVAKTHGQSPETPDEREGREDTGREGTRVGGCAAIGTEGA